MYIAIALKKLLEDKEVSKKLAGIPVKAICQMNDTISVADHIWLEDANLKMEYMNFKKTGNPVLDNGMIAGALSAISTDGVLVTDDETLLRTEKIEYAKGSLVFAESLKDSIDAYKASEKKKGGKKRREKTAPTASNEETAAAVEQTQEVSESHDAVLEPEKNDPPAQPVTEPDPYMNMPEEDDDPIVETTPVVDEVPDSMEDDEPAKENPSYEEEMLSEADSAPEMETASYEAEASTDVRPESEKNTFSEEAEENFDAANDADPEAETETVKGYDQSDRVHAKVYPDDFTGMPDSPEFKAFSNALLSHQKALKDQSNLALAMHPYVLTAFQTSRAENEFYFRLCEVFPDSEIENDLFMALAEFYNELKPLADAVEPVEAYLEVSGNE